MNGANRSHAQFRRALTFFLCVLFCFLSLGGLIAQAATLSVGQPAPPLAARTFDGNSFNWADAANKVVIVNFWASWCSPCRKEMPVLDSYYSQHKAEGLLVLAINVDDPKNAQAVRDIMRDFSFPAAFAQDAQYASYGRIWRLPMTFVIDRKGILRKDGSVGDPKIDLLLLDKLVTPLLSASPSSQ